MADYNIKAEITADASGYEAGVKKAEKASKNLSTSVSKVIQGLGKNGLVGALGAVGLASSGLSATLGSVVKIARKVSQTIGECTDAYKKQIIAERQLDTAIKNNPLVSGASADALKQFASEMQKVSNYGDEELIPMMANLVSLGRTESETMQIMKVALDMSASGSMSLDTAITQLNATLNGNIGRLGQQNAELKGLTEEELKQGKAVEILGEKFKGLASATADTSKQLQNIKGDFKEALGEFTLPSSDMWNKFWSGFYTKGIEVINQFNDYLDRNIIGKQIATNLMSNAGITARAMGVSRESLLDDLRYVQEQLEYLSDSELETYIKYLENLNKRTDGENNLLKIAQRLYHQKELQTVQDKKNAEAREKAVKEAQAQADKEETVIALKEKYLKAIAEQERKWKNITKVTGEEISNEEKLKFYQEKLVAIMTESGGLITENNQYYKDQKKIIDELIKLIKEQGGEVVETETEVVNVSKSLTEQLHKFFENIQIEAEDWSSTFSSIYQTMQQAFADTFTQLGEALVEGGKSWKDYSAIAIKAIADILSALGKQLSVMAIAKAVSHDYAGAVKAMAGATMAFTASGVLTSVANRIGQVSSSVGEMTDKLKQAKVSLEDLRREFESINQRFTQTTSTYMSTFADLNNSIETAQNNASKAFASIIKTTTQLTKVRKELETYQQMSVGFTGGPSTGTYGPWSYQEYTYMQELSKEVDKLQNELSEWKEVLQGNLQAVAEGMAKLNSLFDEIIDNYKAQIATIDDLVQSYNYFYGVIASGNASIKEYNVILYEQLLNVKKLISSVYTTVAQAGQDIGSTLISSIIDGASKEDFLRQMKNYIRQNLLKLAVYTESFQNRLAEVGTKIATALTMGGSIADLRKELEKLWNEASTQAKAVEQAISSVFGDLEEIVEDTVEEISEGIEEVEEKLSTFETAMNSFKESISDLGGDLAGELINGISEGLNEGDFLSNMKQWIRKMLVQSVVYTQSMKAEIEAIGKAITKAMSEGFTETSFHEIRRDLSWVFEQANQTISGIDEILNSVFGGGYATGTNNATSGLHLVGEAGPELVRFKGGEKVYNAKDTRNMIIDGNAGNTFNVTFQNTKDTTAFAMIQQLKAYNRQMAINGIM